MTQGAQPGALGQPRGMGGSFKREGPYVYLWLIHVDVWQKPTQYCKAFIFQIKRGKKKSKTVEFSEFLKEIFTWEGAGSGSQLGKQVGLKSLGLIDFVTL